MPPAAGDGSSGGLTPYQAVLFDVGGTLMHMPRSREDIFVELCSEMGCQVSPEEAAAASLASERYYIDHYLGYTGDQGEFWLRYHAEALGALRIPDPGGEMAARLSHGFGSSSVWRPFAEAERCLRSLRDAGLRLGVVSNGPATVRDQLSSAGLLDFFEVVITSQEAGIEKPDPRIFRLAMAALGLGPEHILYVGDLYDVDVAGARSAGIRAFLIDRGGSSARECPTISSLEELVPVAAGLASFEPDAPSARIPSLSERCSLMEDTVNGGHDRPAG